LLAAEPNGATEAIMLAQLAHGFEHALLDDLVLRGLATARWHARILKLRNASRFVTTDSFLM
jgi:hypothetical protein